MSLWLTTDIAVFAIVALLTGIIIPQILLIAFRNNLFDEVDPRKIHKGAVPRLGGIAFLPAILFGLFLVIGSAMMIDRPEMTAPILRSLRPVSFMMCGGITMWLVGMADDLVGVRYRAKFYMQTIAAVLLIVGGVEISDLHGLLGIGAMHWLPSALLTVLVAVFIINAFNLIDGIDGLASGLSGIVCLFYAFVFYQSGLYLFSVIAVGILGALVPFFIYNVFGNAQKHRKIFMGDTGALTIGILLSAMAMRICRIPELPVSGNSAVVAFAPLLIPGLDVVRVYLHRLKAHRNPFLPDKTHIHHKLLALGMHQRYAMLSIIGFAALVTAANYLLSGLVNINLLFAADILLWILLNILLTRLIRAREARLGRPLYE